MIRPTHLFVVVLFFLFCEIDNAQAVSPDPDKNPDLSKLLLQARDLLDSKQPQAAIANSDKVIAAFTAHYGKSKSKVYCAKTMAENLGYLVMAAAAMTEGKFQKGKHDAIVLSSTWSDAYYLKGYALQELGRIRDAQQALKLAVDLSPWNSQYLSELGSIYIIEKNWSKAQEVFELAEDEAALAPDDSRADVIARARRGLGYVFVELGKLKEAEKKYQQCLAADPNDTRAARELEYVRGLLSKKRGKSL